MSSLTGAHIFTGAWVDWSRGAVLGSTLTLSSRWASVLTAFLALFVTIVSSCLWRILSYTIHQLSSTSQARDGLHHQHQLIFRNSTSPAEATKSFTETAWHWRRAGRKPWSRSLPLAILALLFMIAFSAASILTGLITQAAGAQRLIVSGSCGFWAVNASADINSRTVAMQNKDLNDTILAASYARQCYAQASSLNNLRCSTYTKPRIQYTESEVSCPFADPSICSAPRAFQLDSGVIDSHHDLGINAPQSGRVGFRHVATCSPLKVTQQYVQVINSTGLDGLGLAGDRIRKYQYGTYTDAGLGNNITYMYNQDALIDGFGYELVATQAPLDATQWTSIPELDQTSADLTLIFLASNSIKYTYPTNDPFFSANFRVDLGTFAGVDLSYYSADEYVGVMACQDQYQYCSVNMAENQCTPLTGYQQAYSYINETSSTSLEFNSLQFAVASRLILTSRALSIYHSIGGRGASALLASETVQNQNQLSELSSTQWQREVSSWYDVSLAKMQRSAVEYAASSVSKDAFPPGSYLEEPFDAATKALCYSQKVGILGDTVSFSVLGLVIVLAVGMVIIIVFFLLEPTVSWLQSRGVRGGPGSFRRVRWILDDKLQVQRMMFEEAGMGGKWTNLDGHVPVTEARDVIFGGLEGVDFKEPRLGRSQTFAHDKMSHDETQYGGIQTAPWQGQPTSQHPQQDLQLYFPPPPTDHRFNSPTLPESNRLQANVKNLIGPIRYLSI
ncbi:hypothetical protein B0A52_05684 [Exophiala mesophila]|uniref:Uncharacterized protein n=1 Tax=Exophiala mesophila TaxID=212818 RepID=A0A438N292_EXOME|nr:hypothetical protein B0A52_05684 [Exophiala mesophila]